jgi:hypothetical protein
VISFVLPLLLISTSSIIGICWVGTIESASDFGLFCHYTKWLETSRIDCGCGF